MFHRPAYTRSVLTRLIGGGIAFAMAATLLAGCAPKPDKEVWLEMTRNAEDAFAKGDYRKAEQLALESLDYAEKHHLEDDTLATSLTDLSVFLGVQKKYDDAEKYSERAVDLYQKTGKADTTGMALVLLNRASVHYHKQQYAEAEKGFLEALRIYEKLEGDSGKTVATTRSNLGSLYRKQNKYAQARVQFEKALAITRKLKLRTPEGVVLSNLGALASDEGRMKDAEPLFKEAIAIHEESLGVSHPLVADDLEAYAKCLKKMGRTEDEKKALDRVKSIRQRK